MQNSVVETGSGRFGEATMESSSKPPLSTESPPFELGARGRQIEEVPKIQGALAKRLPERKQISL